MIQSIRRMLSNSYMKAMTLTTSLFDRHGVAVIGYHSISDYQSKLCVSPDEFEMQMQWIADRGIRSLSMSEYVQIVREKRNVKNCMLITFDDGYVDFIEHALDRIKKHGLSATVFVAPTYVGESPHWLSRDESRIRTLIDAFPFSSVEKEQLLEWNHHFASQPLMNWDQLHELSQQGIDVQSHSMSHHFLTHLDHESLVKDLAGSRSELESRLSRKIEAIAYPYGDCSERVARASREVGYAVGFMATPQPFKDPLRIGRTQIGGSNMNILLKFALSAASNWTG